MNDEPIPDPAPTLRTHKECSICHGSIIGDTCWIPGRFEDHRCCQDCYSEYVKKRFGGGKTPSYDPPPERSA
jgi:hypothetical protein